MWLNTQICPVLHVLVPREMSGAMKVAYAWFKKYGVVFLGSYANMCTNTFPNIRHKHFQGTNF